MCKSWTDEYMTAYVKHQRSLELKRKAKREGDVLLEVCTGAVGSAPSDEVMEDEGSLSSASVSVASHSNLESFVESRLQEQDSKLDSKLESFVASFASLIRTEMRALIAEKPQDVVHNVLPNVLLLIMLHILIILFQLPGKCPYNRTMRSNHQPPWGNFIVAMNARRWILGGGCFLRL